MKKKMIVILTAIALLGAVGCQKREQADVPVVTLPVEGDNENVQLTPTEEVKATEVTEPTKALKLTATPELIFTPEATATPEPIFTPEATATPEPTSTSEATATPEPTSTPEATATPEPTSTPEATATPELTVKIREITTLEDGSIPTYWEGGVIITKKNGLYGAVNEKCKQIVENEYESIWLAPSADGQFVLKKGENVDCFDAEGNLLLTIERPGVIRIAEGYITYSYTQYDEENGWGGKMLGIYDIKNKKNLSVEKIPYPTGIYMGPSFDGKSPAEDWPVDEVTAVMDGKFYASWNTPWCSIVLKVDVETLEVEKIYNVNDDMFWFQQPQGGYSAIREQCYRGAWLGLLSEDGKEEYRVDVLELMELCEIPEEVGVYYSTREYYSEGRWHKNIGKQVAMQIKSLEDNSVHSFLVDFSDAEQVLREIRGSYGTASMPMVSNLSEIILAKYDYINLSPSGNYLVGDDGDWFYINAKGEKIADYEDCSDFVGDFALVIEDDGMAYVVDKKFNKVSKGYPADGVRSAVGALCIVNDGENTLLYVTK